MRQVAFVPSSFLMSGVRTTTFTLGLRLRRPSRKRPNGSEISHECWSLVPMSTLIRSDGAAMAPKAAPWLGLMVRPLNPRLSTFQPLSRPITSG